MENINNVYLLIYSFRLGFIVKTFLESRIKNVTSEVGIMTQSHIGASAGPKCPISDPTPCL